jgi:hypothetical protein
MKATGRTTQDDSILTDNIKDHRLYPILGSEYLHENSQKTGITVELAEGYKGNQIIEVSTGCTLS